jgi:hypothetical protein
LFSASPCIRAAAALATLAIMVSGCAAANNAASNQASSQGEQPYKTMYGLSSEGTTTDLYTVLFGSSQPAPAPPQTTVATAQPTQPAQSAAAQPATSPPPPAATMTSPARPAQAATATAANRSPQAVAPPPAPVQVAQPPAPAPAPPPEPDVPTAYGITANGPTTDLYTMIFGPRRSEGQ